VADKDSGAAALLVAMQRQYVVMSLTRARKGIDVNLQAAQRLLCLLDERQSRRGDNTLCCDNGVASKDTVEVAATTPWSLGLGVANADWDINW
jgi:hypothetical protein